MDSNNNIGNVGVQVNITLDYKTIAMFAAGLFIAVAAALIIYKKS